MENRDVNMNEEWIKRKQYDNLEDEYVVTDLVQDMMGTRIRLQNGTNIVEVFFDGIPILIRQTVEGVRMRTWGEIQKKNQDKFFFRDTILFEVKNSKLIKWCLEESCGFFREDELKHYCISTSEEFIDIVATFEPQINTSQISSQ